MQSPIHHPQEQECWVGPHTAITILFRQWHVRAVLVKGILFSTAVKMIHDQLSGF